MKKEKKNKYTISGFPSVITHTYTSLYSQEGDIVFDPFIGRNSRAEDVLSLNRFYHGYDIHTEPCKHTINILKKNKKYEGKYKITQGDSTKTHYPDEFFDFIITSPPYYNAEKYNEIYNEYKARDLSSYKTFYIFCHYYELCIREMFRILKKNKYMVIVVGNIVNNNKLLDLDYETRKIARKISLPLHTVDIYNKKNNISKDINYTNNMKTSKRLPIIYEYILVFQKPERVLISF